MKMFKVQVILLNLICLLMLETSIVEANDALWINDNNIVAVKPISDSLCPENLLDASVSPNNTSYDSGNIEQRLRNNNNRVAQPVSWNESVNNFNSVKPKEDAYLLKYKDKSLEELREVLLLERIRLIEDEQDMIQQGYTPNYVAGLDTVKAGLQMAHLLRQRFSDQQYDKPEEVHIPEFIQFIDPHIDSIEEGIRRSDSSDRDMRLSQLEHLRSEAQSRQQTKQVTYLWLMHFTVQLAVLATPIGDRIGLEKTEADGDWHSYLFKSVNKFPDVIVLPTINDLGISTINRGDGTSVHFIGLINGPVDVHIHQAQMFPDGFLAHDVGHINLKEIVSQLQIKDVNTARMAILFNIYLMYKLRNLPRHQKESFDFVYFGLTSEVPGLIHYGVRGVTHLADLHFVITFFSTNQRVSHLVPSHFNPNNSEDVRKLAENFTEFVLEFNTELNSLGITNRP